MEQACDLASKQCQPRTGGGPPLAQAETDRLMRQLEGWLQHDTLIGKTYRFQNYYQVIAFVNGIAWIAHRENHHPNLTVAYDNCRVEYTTHAIGGLSDNDFICAAKVDALFKL